jgi:hypothetical protein
VVAVRIMALHSNTSGVKHYLVTFGAVDLDGINRALGCVA